MENFAEYPVAWPTPPPFFALRSSPERATKDGKQLRRPGCGELHCLNQRDQITRQTRLVPDVQAIEVPLSAVPKWFFRSLLDRFSGPG